jgi:hypothetical protein
MYIYIYRERERERALRLLKAWIVMEERSAGFPQPNTWGYNWATLFLGEPGPPSWGRLKNRDNKLCSWVSWDSDLRKDTLAMPSKNRKLQTRLLAREGVPQKQIRSYLKIIEERRRRISRRSQMGACYQDRISDWLSVVTLVWLESVSIETCDDSPERRR